MHSSMALHDMPHDRGVMCVCVFVCTLCVRVFMCTLCVCAPNYYTPHTPCGIGRIAEIFVKSGTNLTQEEPNVFLRLNVFYRVSE